LYQDLYYCKGKKNINKIRIFIKVNNCCRTELVSGSNKKAEDSENLEIPKQACAQLDWVFGMTLTSSE